MLVLSRKLGQSFRVGPEVRVTIVKIDRNSVRIGIEAPDDVSVQREEIAFEMPKLYRSRPERPESGRPRTHRRLQRPRIDPSWTELGGSSKLASSNPIHWKKRVASHERGVVGRRA